MAGIEANDINIVAAPTRCWDGWVDNKIEQEQADEFIGKAEDELKRAAAAGGGGEGKGDLPNPTGWLTRLERSLDEIHEYFAGDVPSEWATRGDNFRKIAVKIANLRERVKQKIAGPMVDTSMDASDGARVGDKAVEGLTRRVEAIHRQDQLRATVARGLQAARRNSDSQLTHLKEKSARLSRSVEELALNERSVQQQVRAAERRTAETSTEYQAQTRAFEKLERKVKLAEDLRTKYETEMRQMTEACDAQTAESARLSEDKRVLGGRLAMAAEKVHSLSASLQEERSKGEGLRAAWERDRDHAQLWRMRLEENQANIKAIKEEVRLARSAEQAFEAELAEILQKIPDAPAPSDHEKKRGHGKLAEAEESPETSKGIPAGAPPCGRQEIGTATDTGGDGQATISKPEETPMPIHIVDLLGCTKDLRVCPSSTIAEVKSRIQEKEGVPPGLQLTFADNILENGRTLRDCGLQPDCTLHSSLQLRGRKPVILLYTPAEMEVSVRLTLGPEWNFSALYPEPSWKGRLPPPDKGIRSCEWRVRASPNGSLLDVETSKQYPYLFWEADSEGGRVVRIFELDGTPSFCVAGNKAGEFLDDALTRLGLNARERCDMITYWLLELQAYPFNAIYFVDVQRYSQAAKLDIEPAPDVTLRVFMAFRGLSAYDAGLDTAELSNAQAPARRGFVAVEWGGMNLNGIV